MNTQPLAVLVDFDETAAEQNVAELLLTAFCQGDWRSLREAFRAGRLTLREYQERAFAAVSAPVEAMARYVQEHARLRHGFPDLARFCYQNHIPLAIVTNGLQFYVEALLGRYGVLPYVTIHAVQVRFTAHGPVYTYPWATPYCWEWGNCKCRVVDIYRQQRHRILYVGDSSGSDLCPAARSDILFAHKSLLEYCQLAAIPAHPLRDFTDVLKVVQASSVQEAHRA
ncbi:MAG: HAD-IB family phosphatase [Dehalococcoidia bacterium]|nr:HAD-IB family phosphatase [Dehalococcoidia bacterium]MDW8120582.1 HAD-IB family phosphatase [Chloroflexota bacterium]